MVGCTSHLGQALDTVEHDGRFRLRTISYWYRIQHEPELRAKAALRWEYDRSTKTDEYARHHAQLAAEMQLGSRKLDLDKAHLPTGWVTIEEVIRFLIVDLGLEPPGRQYVARCDSGFRDEVLLGVHWQVRRLHTKKRDSKRAVTRSS